VGLPCIIAGLRLSNHSPLPPLPRGNMNSQQQMWQYNYDHREEIAAHRIATQPRRDAARELYLNADVNELKKLFMHHTVYVTEETLEATAILNQVLQERLSSEAWQLICQDKRRADHERHRCMCKNEWVRLSTQELLELFQSPSWQAKWFCDTFKPILRARLTTAEWNEIASSGHHKMR
jgi:hypothetical protein